MNINLIKEEIKNHINNKVQINIYGLRNKNSFVEGKICNIYPNLFEVLTEDGIKTFSYADIATKELVIKYL